MLCVECGVKKTIVKSPYCSTCDPAFWPIFPAIPIETLIDKLNKYKDKHRDNVHISFWFHGPPSKEKLIYPSIIQEEEEILFEEIGDGTVSKEIRFHLKSGI